MERLLRRRLVFKTVMILSLIMGALGLVGTVVFSLLVTYLPLFISLAFLANALYGTVFYYIGYSNAAACISAVSEIERGIRKVSELAAAMHRTEAAAEALLSKCIVRGIITGFVISDGVLSDALQNSEENNENIEGEN